MPNSLKNKKNSGFTLVELALVLVIAGMLLSLAASVGAARIDGQRIKDTNARMNFIMAAIKQYVRNYKHLPCPAAITGATSLETSTSFGFGAGTNIDDTPTGNCTATAFGANTIEIGAVPVRELGISPAVTVDGWGNRIVYAVDEDLTYVDRDIDPITTTPCGTNGGIVGGGYTDFATAGTLDVTLTDGTTSITTAAAVLLMSHGPNGIGAYFASSGTKSTATSTAGEAENYDYNDDIFAQGFPTSTFDDIVVFAEKWQLPWVCEQ